MGMAVCLAASAQQRIFTDNQTAFNNLRILSHENVPGVASSLPGVSVSSRPYAPHMPVFQASSNQVQVSVVVRDRSGRALPGLDRSAFSLYADGRPVVLNYFNPSTSATAALETASSPAGPALSAPAEAAGASRYVALFVDDFSMTAQQLAIARNAAKKVAASGMDGIKMGIFTTSGTPSLGFTSDRTEWENTISQLHPETQMPEDGITPGGRFNPYLAQLIQLNVKQYVAYGAQVMKSNGMCQDSKSCESIARAQADYTSDFAHAAAFDTMGALRQTIAALAAQPGARTLVLASAGFMTDQTDGRPQALIAQALKDGIVIDSLDAKLLETEPPGSTPMELELWSANQMSIDQVLQTVADDTGGTYFHNNDIGGAMRQAALAPEPRYMLGFAPAAMPADGKFHRLQVRVIGPPHISVQARRGYYDPEEGDWGSSSISLKTLDEWVAGPAAPTEIPTSIGAGWLKTATGGTEVELQVHIPVTHKTGGTELVTAIFDPLGRFVIGRAYTIGLHLDGSELKKMSKAGVAIRFRLPLAPGTYRLRQIVYGLDTHNRSVLDRAFLIPK